jgi:hypothetical protein
MQIIRGIKILNNQINHPPKYVKQQITETQIFWLQRGNYLENSLKCKTFSGQSNSRNQLNQ